MCVCADAWERKGTQGRVRLRENPSEPKRTQGHLGNAREP